jgi:hypothetical protein
VTKDGGTTWKEIINGLPYRKWVSRLAASAFDLGTVYMSQNGKRDDDFAAYLWKSTDFGETWQDISANIPCGPINVVREDPKNKNVLYVGTDFGVYVTLNGGNSWQSLPGNLPTTYVQDLVIHPRENILLAATHGRGMWALDASFIQQLTDDVSAKKAHLFDIESAKLPSWMWWHWGRGQEAFMVYYLKGDQKVNLTIKDGSGKVVKEMQAAGHAGLNVSTWDLKMKEDPKAKKSGRQNPFVKAGTYTVILKAGPVTGQKTIEIKK